MKKKIIIVLFLYSLSSFGQKFEDIKKLDTIYIIYSGSKLEKKNLGKENENPSRFYNFAGFKNGKETIDFTFTKFKYKYSALDSKIETEIKIINKSFIKKNKYRIIRSDFFKKYEICDIGYHILNNGKIFYIIDLTERIRGKTKAYEVIASQVCNKEDNN